MKKTSVILLLLLAYIGLQAQVSQSYFQEAVFVDDGSVDVEYIPTFPTQNFDDSNILPNEEFSSETNVNNNSPDVFAPLWGDDILVTNECNINTSMTKLALDYDWSGNTYVAILSDHGSSDTLYIYKSTDKGYTWSRGWSASYYSTGVDVLSYDMRIEIGSYNPFIYTAAVFVYNNDTSVVFRRMSTDSTLVNWYIFPGYEDIKWVEMDITDSQNPYIYILLTTPGYPYSLRRCSSSDGGATWTTGTITSYQKSSRYFDLATGPDDNAYVFWYRTPGDSICVMRYISHFTALSGLTTLGTEDSLYYPWLASARHYDYPTNAVYLVYQSKRGLPNTAARSFEYKSTDGGTTWSAPTYFLAGDNVAVNPYISCGRYNNNSDGFVGTVIQRYDGTDSVVVGYKSYHLQAWSTFRGTSQYRPSSSVAAQAIFIQGLAVGGGFRYVYNEYSSDNIWLDRFDYFNAVEENPSPVTGITYNPNQVMFSFSLPYNTSGTIRIYDMLGRNINTLYSGDFSKGENSFTWDYKADDISSGSYIMLFSIPGKTISEKFSIVN